MTEVVIRSYCGNYLIRLRRRGVLVEERAEDDRAGRRGGQMQSGFEMFPMDDLTGLRDDLRRSGLDSWQAAELISAFLIARGYGVSNSDARDAVARLDSWGDSLQTMQEVLGKLAMVM